MTAAINMIGKKASMAYVGELPWHGLGQRLTEGSPIEVWAKEAGMNWKVQRSKIRYATSAEKAKKEVLSTWEQQHVLFRSDTHAPLGLVSENYKVVQPGQVLEFFRDLTERNNMRLETAGVLFGGERYWALAKTGHDLRVAGTDVLGGYLLLATSCDGSMATTAKFTSIRVVCQNTLTAAMHSGASAVRVPHNSVFDATQVKVEMGLLDEAWSELGEKASALAKRPITKKDAITTLIKAWGDFDSFVKDIKSDGVDKAFENQPKARVMAEIIQLWDGKGLGADLKSSKGTAWGLVNAATQYFDHSAGRSQDRRLASAWFGKNDRKKTDLFEESLKLVA